MNKNIFSSIEEYGNRVALIEEKDEVISYLTLVEIADRIALESDTRSLVFFMSRNSRESVAGYVGFLRKKVVPVMINENISKDFFESLMDSYRPKYLYAPIDKINKQYSILYIYGEYALARTRYIIDYTLHDDLALLITTSGSTGSPKLVRQTYRNIEANTKSIIISTEIVEEDKAITTLPMSYTYGLSIINSHLYCGASLVLTEATLMNKNFWSLIREQQVTMFGGVPYTYEILKKLRFNKMNLPSLRYITQAGGKLPRELAEEISIDCKEKNRKFFVMYGQTEATARMAYLPWDYALTKAGSIGIAIPGGSFWIEDEMGCEIKEDNLVGQLIYKGENVSYGYASNCYDLCIGDINKGILYTGDMAIRDSDGFYYIVGRNKRFIKLFGNRVNLDEIEELLRAEKIDCACTGEDNQLRIYITEVSQEENVHRYIKDKTGINFSGYKIFTKGSIPRNESGKILYNELK